MSKDYLQLIDRNTEGQRYDITPLFANPGAFSSLIDDLTSQYNDIEYDAVAAIDALGFILGAGIAHRVGKGLIPIRKGGKLPVQTHAIGFIDYTGRSKSLELRRGAFAPGSKLILVDEWVETGAQINAAIELIQKSGGIVVGIASINIDRNDSTKKLFESYNCFTVWEE
jgi:adenine phosphoribosyltransferase